VRQAVNPEYGKPARHHQQDCPRVSSPAAEEVHGWAGCWYWMLLVFVYRRRLMNGWIPACAGMTEPRVDPEVQSSAESCSATESQIFSRETAMSGDEERQFGDFGGIVLALIQCDLTDRIVDWLGLQIHHRGRRGAG
jgi:hypothetical protein